MNNIKYMLKNAKKRRVIFSVIAVMSVLAAFTVYFVLEKPGVTMTADDLPEYISYSESGAVIVEVPADEEPKYMGTIAGYNCKFSIYENGVIYFEPADPTKTYTIPNSTSFSQYKSEITAVKAADGLENVSTSAFDGFAQLSSIDLSECSTLKTLGNYVFRDCTLLTDINFGENSPITSIGSRAFYNCTLLEQFPFEQLTNVETISDYAFQYCSSLKLADLSKMTRLKSIPYQMFVDCTALKQVNFSKIAPITSIGRSAFSGCTSLEQFPFEQLPNVNRIDEYAFSGCKSLKSADLSGMTKLTKIPNQMFNNCTSLIDINFGENSPITSIGQYAFNGCTSLKSVDLSGMTQLTAIPNYMFQNCTALTDVNFGENSKITSIGGFYHCVSLKSVDLSGLSGLTKINDNAFKFCFGLESVKLPDVCEINEIGKAAFSCCASLSDFPFEKLTKLEKVYDDTYTDYGGSSSANGEYTYNGVRYRGHYGSFANCSSLTFVDLSATQLEKIGGGMFYNCTALKDVVLSDNCTAIGHNVFGYTALEDFPSEQLTNVETIGVAAFAGCKKITSVDLSVLTKLTAIPDRMFSGCTALTDVNFGDNSQVTSIGAQAFYSCQVLKKVKIPENSPITSIGQYAFYGCTSLEQFPFEQLPDVSTIGTYAFRDCSSLTSVDLSGMTELTEISDNTFGDCSALTDVNLGENSYYINKIGNWAFQGTALQEFNFQNCPNLESIGVKAFNEADLEKADLSNLTNLKTVGYGCFQNCTNLKEVSFKGCTNLKSIEWTSPEGGVFDKTPLKSVDFTDCSSLTDIGKRAFNNQTDLIEVKLDGCTSLISIDDQAFYNCKNLKEITLPEKLETIGSQALQNCYTLEKIDYNAANITSVGTNAFYGAGLATDLTVNIGSNVDKLPDSIFANGVKIKEINFEGPNDSLYLGVDALKSMGRPLSAMSDGTTEYYVDEFGVIYSKDRTELYYIPHGLESYTVPAGVTTIKKDCCKLADSLTSLTFDDISAVTTVESNAFAECKTLGSITADGVTVTTVEGAENLFKGAGATVGLHAFYNTGLLDVTSTSKLTKDPVQVTTYNGSAKEYEVTLQFVDNDKNDKVSERCGKLDPDIKRIPSVEPVNEDIYYYLTDEVATFNVSVSAFSAGADTESGNEFEKYARIYFQCSSDNVIFENYIVGKTTTITNTAGMEYEVTFRQVENSNIYYLEFAMPYGNTLSFDSRVYVPNLTDQNATMKMWLQIAETTDTELELEPEQYQEAEWYTAIPKWSIKHTAPTTEYGFKAVSTESGNTPKIKSDISFSISNSKTSTSSKSGYGIDPTKSLSFTEWLTLPDGIEWEPHIVEAIKNGDYYCTGTSPYIYLNTSEGTVQLAYISVASEDVKVVWDDVKNSPVVIWKIKNKNLSNASITNDANYDMSTSNYSITYNADEIFKIADDYDFTQASRIYSNVIQNPKYVFAEPNDTTKHTINTDETEVPRDSVFEQAAQTGVVIGTAKPDISLEKTAIYNDKIYGFGYNNRIDPKMSEKTEFILKAKNSGYVPGTVTRVADPLSTYLTIRPDDMETMFNDTYGKELTITITKGYKDTSDKNQRESVIDVNGNEIDITAVQKGDTMEMLDTITIKWADDKGCLVLTCGDEIIRIGSGEEYETIQEYFNAIEFINIRETKYNCEWYMENPAIGSLEERKYVIPATFKSDFELLQTDKVSSTRRDFEGSSYNSGYYSVNNIDYSNYYGRKSNEIQLYLYNEFYISKNYSINGVANAKTIKNGDICDFSIDIKHSGTGELTGVPVNDYMTGSHSALAPVVGNENAVLIITGEDGNETKVKLSEAGLRTVAVDGAEYYILSENGTYKDIWFGYDEKGNLLRADRIEVTKNAKTLTTRMYWYLDEVQGTVSKSVKYKSIIDDQAGLTLNTGDMSINNWAYLGERTDRHLIAYLSGNKEPNISFISASFDKNIVTEDPAGENEKLAEHSEIGEGDSVTYKLTLNNYSDYNQYFTNAYDMLPESYGKFAWTKADGMVTMYTVSSLDTPNTSADKWKISDIQPNGESSGGAQYYIYWNDVADCSDLSNPEKAAEFTRSGITLRPHETLDIYITLKYPSDKSSNSVWTDYEEAAFDAGNKITNHFVVSNQEATVTHTLKATGQAYLQKGVYGVYDASGLNNSYYGNSCSNRGTRTEYTNRTQTFPIVTYYVTIYNSGNARLYLNDMVDTLPKGFTYIGMCSVTDYGSASTGNADYYNESGYIKANNAGYRNAGYLLTYRYKDSDSGRNANNILSPVTDVKNNSVEYMSAYVHYTSISKKDVNGDYQEKMKFSFLNKYSTYNSSNIGYDSEKDMCYLEKGQAISFGYRCYVPEYQYTEDIANNRISMQYYDYNGAGFKKSEGVTVAGNYTNYTSSTNDGGCDIWSDFEASTAGLEGEYTTDWLTSDVDLVRGSITPGVTKQITSKISQQGVKETCQSGLINSADTAEWTMTYSNDGTGAIDNYTITDTMQYPFYFTGDVTYKIGNVSATYSSSYPLLGSISFKDANGDEITQSIDKYNKEDITITFKTLGNYSSSTPYYNSYSAKLGEETICSVYTGSKTVLGPDSSYSSYEIKVKFDIDENYNCILQITFDEASRGITSIAPGGYATMTAQTKLPKSEMPSGNFVNTVRFSPNMYYDADNVIKGAVVRDESGEVEGIEASSMIAISGAYTTTSWKTITDDSDPDNNAASREVDNYIVLKWDDEQDWDENSEYPPCSPFTYALSVQNLCIKPISRMVIIDDLPEVGDHMSYGDETSPRYSEFMVALTEIAEEKFSVWDEDTQIMRVADSGSFTEDKLGYTIEFSTATEFSPEDWDGKDGTAANWLSLEEAAQQVADGTLKISEIRSLRVVVKGGEGIAKEHTLTVKANARVYGKVDPGQIAWNNFGYRYAAPLIDTTDLELSASSLNVGIMTATTPKIKKVINAGTGRDDITAAGLNASAEFVVYCGEPIKYENEQELFKKLYDDSIDFTVVTLSPEQIDSGEYVSLDNPMAYSIRVDGNGNYSYELTETKFPWTESEKYTFTEINLPENVIFSSMQGSKSNEYTITYARNGRYKINCVNIYDDYAITVRKANAKDGSPLEGAGFARYGVITGTLGDPEYEKLVEQMWSENVNSYIDTVKSIQELEATNRNLHVLSTIDPSRLESAKDSYERFAAIQGTVSTITDISDIGQYFSQLYRIDNGDGTETVYYFIDFNMTDENGRITYPSEVTKNFAFLETVAPEGFTLTYRLNLSSRGNVSSGGTLYVDISNSYATELPMTGGRGMLYIILTGAAVMLLSTAAVIIRVKRKGGAAA